MGALAGVPQQRYSEEEIENGLQALAFHGSGNVASELTDIPESTLSYWRRNRAERYAEIRAELLPQIRKRLAAWHEDNALQALEKAREAMEGMDLTDMSASDRAKATQQLAVASGVYTDKASVMRGLPTMLVEHATAEEVLKRLKGQAPSYVIDSTAEEISDAEVVENGRAV